MVKQNSNNGTTLRTRIVRDKTKYNRKQKHKKSFAEAGDFSFIKTSLLFFTLIIYKTRERLQTWLSAQPTRAISDISCSI